LSTRPRTDWPHPIIAREGWPFVAAAFVASALITWFFGWWSVPFWLGTLFIVQFFRDPPREVPQDPAAVLAPADGRIVEVSRAQDPYLKR
jgi:phosphatidylserine decarboxylase